ncbi:ATP-binding cassette domain-containing protein, partial [Frisingicoccus sp.]|uniref:ATP-binding cassette domain-containing protein n=1 Tax=Frisingicoccus sp. TaxID=1918627 RepID=UPI0039943AD1
MSHVKTDEALLQVRGLKKHFGHLEVLRGIDIDIHKGEVVAVIGPSGSGKSTFIRCLNRLEEPTAGEVIFEGQQINTKRANIDKIRQKIFMVFQNFNLFSNLTIMQ